MKKIILLTLLVSLSSCTKTPEQKAQKSVSDYLVSKLDDPKSYESVSFGKLKSTFTDIKDDPKYLKLEAEYIEANTKQDEQYQSAMSMTHDNTIKEATDLFKKRMAITKSIGDEIADFRKNFKPQSILIMNHKYRARNKMGALVLDSLTFTMDRFYKVKAEREAAN